MEKSVAVLESRNQLRMIEVAAMRDMVMEALKNPLLVLIGGAVAVKVIEKTGVFDENTSKVLLGSLVGITTVQVMAPVVKESGIASTLLAMAAGGAAGGAAIGGWSAVNKMLYGVPGIKQVVDVVNWLIPGFD